MVSFHIAGCGIGGNDRVFFGGSIFRLMCGAAHRSQRGAVDGRWIQRSALRFYDSESLISGNILERLHNSGRPADFNQIGAIVLAEAEVHRAIA